MAEDINMGGFIQDTLRSYERVRDKGSDSIQPTVASKQSFSSSISSTKTTLPAPIASSSSLFVPPPLPTDGVHVLAFEAGGGESGTFKWIPVYNCSKDVF